MFGSSEELNELRSNRCRQMYVQCAGCGGYDFICVYVPICPNCGGKNFHNVPWWYGRDIPKNENVQGKELEDGRRIVPKFFVEVHAFLHPVDNDPFLTWLSAEDWYNVRGWEIMGNKEWYSYSKRVIRVAGDYDTLYFTKEEG